MRVGFLGPEGTYSEEALLAARGAGSPLGPGVEIEPVPLPTIYETVMAVHERAVERAIVPIENSVEGSVNVTLDTLATQARDVTIVGETIQPVRHCLIARTALALEEIATVVSHPQPIAQCAHFIRTRLQGASVVTASSTAEAVRLVAERDGPWAALGSRLSAELYGCEVLEDGVEDIPGNATRFVWLAPAGTPPVDPGTGGRWKTSIVFWGAGDDTPGWLVRCLSEFAFRGVNLTMIESRPRKLALGHYMFFADLDGRADEDPVARAIDAVRSQTEALRVLGSYPVA